MQNFAKWSISLSIEPKNGSKSDSAMQNIPVSSPFDMQPSAVYLGALSKKNAHLQIMNNITKRRDKSWLTLLDADGSKVHLKKRLYIQWEIYWTGEGIPLFSYISELLIGKFIAKFTSTLVWWSITRIKSAPQKSQTEKKQNI